MNFQKQLLKLSFGLLFFSCQNNNANYVPKTEKENRNNDLVQSTNDELKISQRLSSILSQFIQENQSKDCLNQIYFDKIEPHKTIITITTKTPSLEYLKKQNPMSFLTIDGTKIYVYNGSEKYFEGNHSNIELIEEKNVRNCSAISWNIVDSLDVFRIIKNGGPPFFPLPKNMKIKFDSLAVDKNKSLSTSISKK
jgi:hypothetical protein